MTTGALIILSQQLVDPVFLYGLDPHRNRGADMRVRTIVVDDSDAGVAGTPHPVHRPDTDVLTQTELPFRRNTAERLGMGLLNAWGQRSLDMVFIVSDRVILPNTFAQFYTQAMDNCERRFTSPSGWLNPLAHEKVFSPGFPAHLRDNWEYNFKATADDVKVAAHMGLTRGIPEVSAISIQKKIDRPTLRTVSLWPSGWFPVSYTNFGARRDVIPAMLPVPLGHYASVILAGRLLQALARRKGEAITLGRPIVRRLETPVNAFLEVQELLVETTFIDMLDKIVPELKVGTYLEMMVDFSKRLTLRDLSPWQSLFETWPALLDAWLTELQKRISD